MSSIGGVQHRVRLLLLDNLTAIVFGSLRLYSLRGECFVDKAAIVEFLDEPRIVELIEIHRADLWILRFHQALHRIMLSTVGSE